MHTQRLTNHEGFFFLALVPMGGGGEPMARITFEDFWDAKKKKKVYIYTEF